MARIKKRLIRITDANLFDDIPQNNTLVMLKKAWDELPDDVALGERTLFIELAEKLVNISEDQGSRTN